jgi:glutaconate CoA-transferase subunit B
VITDMGIFRFDSATGEMLLSSLYPGCIVENIQEQVGWPLRVVEQPDVIAPPTQEELRIIRQELDPAGRLRM